MLALAEGSRVGINRLSCTRDRPAVITFVTWRYVALRTFTLHRDAPHPPPFAPVPPRAGKKEERSLQRGENCGGAAEKSRQRDEERGAGIKSSKREDKEGGICFAAYLRNFYDRRLPRPRLENLL